MTCAISFCYGKTEKLPKPLTCQLLVEGTNLTLTGHFENVMATRTEILHSYPVKTQFNLKIPSQDCTKIRVECKKIAKETNTVITVTETLPPSPFVSQNSIHIHISGIPGSAELARVRTLVMLDEQSQLDVDTVSIPYRLHNLICGRKRSGLQSILEETATSIYFPSPFIFEANENYAPPIYITGEKNDVGRVKDMLTKLASQKAQSMYHKDAILHPRKLDWMLLHRRNELRKIMRDNGSFIAFPRMGTGSNLITVYAESRVNAERTLRSLHFLACSIYEAFFYFNRDSVIYGVDTTHNFFSSIANITALVSQLSQISGAEVSYKSETGCIEVYGTERSVRNVYQRLHDMSFLKVFHQSTIFNVELSNDQREFISGKKSGKVNKIMKTSGAKIKFVPFSEYNFIIEVESNNFNKALDGLTLLHEELPAEISFFVPEMYHKRIIGVGGKNIQRIMKKYGVYVKFSNAEEFAALGGYYDNEDNVVARTPMKNQINLENLKHAVMDLINPKDRDCVEQVLTDIPFWMHRTLIRDHASFLKDMTKKTNTHLIWPDDELASDTLTLVGPESQVNVAAQMIRSIIPEEYDIRLPYTSKLQSIFESDAYKDVVQCISNDYNISIEPKNKEQQHADYKEGSDFFIAFKLTKGNLERLNIALDIYIRFMRNQQINIYDDNPIARIPPVVPLNNMCMFPAFDNKFLTSAMPSDLVSPTPSSSSSLLNDFPPALSTLSNGLRSYSLFDYPSAATSPTNPLEVPWSRFRDINSPRTADNIRAIFDSSDLKQPPPPPPSMSFVSPLAFRTGPNSGPNTLDIWSNAPPPQAPMNGFVGSPPLSGFDTKNQSLLYAAEQTSALNGNNGLYHHHSSLGLNKPPAEYSSSTYVAPTSSTSTGSNNSSMHSSQSLPDVMLDSSPKQPLNLPFKLNGNNPATSSVVSSQNTASSLMHSSVSSTTSAAAHGLNKVLSPTAMHFGLTASTSTTTSLPTTAAAITKPASVIATTRSPPPPLTNGKESNKSLEFPALFSMNHSSTDETVLVQNLLNNMSMSQ
ncbi:hypothetical protein BDF20DRAFT_849164 [Mycotypha africana]|uniref:uncharacterized protein n=1 Tax=Mycotypha africana TaxID=64632 RepID=UPI002300A8D6|nr:uncharacterized protein BDF20DRAFT_849164 [Mycotypha africana]KAI8987276.1 hypothetical protein BDF20DRAFT_849164 [Mycotypha africana]